MMAIEVEETLDEPDLGTRLDTASGEDLDRLAGSFGFVRSEATPGYKAETDDQLRKRTRRDLGLR